MHSHQYISIHIVAKVAKKMQCYIQHCVAGRKKIQTHSKIRKHCESNKTFTEVLICTSLNLGSGLGNQQFKALEMEDSEQAHLCH